MEKEKAKKILKEIINMRKNYINYLGAWKIVNEWKKCGSEIEVVSNMKKYLERYVKDEPIGRKTLKSLWALLEWPSKIVIMNLNLLLGIKTVGML
ncbi:Protein of unknown function [Gryllus bimaculatus]|nr:Protein of unknown function [Gryllus bimaculatus]